MPSQVARGPHAVAHSLRGEGFDASEYGTGRGTPIVTTARMTPIGEYVADDTASTVKARDFKDATDLVAFSAKDYGGDATSELCPTLRAGGHDKTHANSGNWPAVAIQERAVSENPDAGPHGKGFRDDGAAFTMESRTVPQAVAHHYAVRRLTPVECERLQGFPDNYTRIAYCKKPAEKCPDGPRYKALGNSWAVPVVAWIFDRLDAVDRAARGSAG